MNIKSYIFCGLIGATLGVAGSAEAGEKQGYLFGDPVIFESSISYGWMNDSSGQSLIRQNAGSLVVNNAEGGIMTVNYHIPGLFFITAPVARLNHTAPRINASLDNDQILDGGFSHSQELSFGIRTQITDDWETFVKFGYTQFKSKGQKQQAFNIRATALTDHGRFNLLFPFGNPPQRIEPGQISQVFTGTGNASIGFSDTDVYSFEIGVKKDVFRPIDFGSVSARFFIDGTMGLGSVSTISVDVSGQLPDVTNMVTADFSRTPPFFPQPIFLPTNAPGFVFELPERAATVTSEHTSSTEVATSAFRPIFAVGTGLEFTVSERTALSLDVQYKYLKAPSNIRDHKIDLGRTTLSLRLSQTF